HWKSRHRRCPRRFSGTRLFGLPRQDSRGAVSRLTQLMQDRAQQTGTIVEASSARYDRWFQTEELQPHLKTKSIRGGASVMVSSSANLAISLVATSVLARILVPTDFGLLGMVFALTVIAEQFKDIGLGRATVQKRELTHAEVTNLFWLNFLLGL